MSAAQPSPNHASGSSARPELTVVAPPAEAEEAPTSRSEESQRSAGVQPSAAPPARPDGSTLATGAVALPRGGQPPTPEQLELLREHSQKLETASPEGIIAWGVEHYFPKLTMATAFGPEGCVIIHMLAKVEPRVHVFNIDTQYQFKETLEL